MVRTHGLLNKHWDVYYVGAVTITLYVFKLLCNAGDSSGRLSSRSSYLKYGAVMISKLPRVT